MGQALIVAVIVAVVIGMIGVRAIQPAKGQSGSVITQQLMC